MTETTELFLFRQCELNSLSKQSKIPVNLTHIGDDLVVFETHHEEYMIVIEVGGLTKSEYNTLVDSLEKKVFTVKCFSDEYDFLDDTTNKLIEELNDEFTQSLNGRICPEFSFWKVWKIAEPKHI